MSSKVVESNISKCVEEIWSKYDKDDNGHLDKDEVRQFVNDLLSDNKHLREADGSAYNDAEFEECFSSFDKDGSGTIDKEEMTKFIKTFTVTGTEEDKDEEEAAQAGGELGEPIEILMFCSSTKRCNPSGKPLVNPEELITQIFARIMPQVVKLKVATCDESLIDEAIDAFDG